MDELLRQLGKLALDSVPTLILFVFLFIAYRFILYGALMKIRAERTARTAGAMEAARLAIAAADARIQEYEARLRAARSEIFHHREQRLQQRYAERDNALAAARVASQQRVTAARAAIEAQTSDARKQIEVSASQLAAQVLATVLPPVAAEGSR